VLGFIRHGLDNRTLMVVVCNFTPTVQKGYRLGVPHPGQYRERLNTDSTHYGGSNTGTPLGHCQRASHRLARQALVHPV
jgi:1,4-alpha-glucan branching enzyme